MWYLPELREKRVPLYFKLAAPLNDGMTHALVLSVRDTAELGGARTLAATLYVDGAFVGTVSAPLGCAQTCRHSRLTAPPRAHRRKCWHR